jgi:cob(I)alamin adenosyltransferase
LVLFVFFVVKMVSKICPTLEHSHPKTPAMTQQPGLVILLTGNGKGKTTSAFGQALRAAGQNLSVCIIQFIKQKNDTGEVRALPPLAERIEIHTTGSGFTWTAKNRQELVEAAARGWQLAQEKIAGPYDMVVLDEFTYLLTHQLIDEAEALQCLRNRPTGQHVVITGRDASPSLIEMADLITEMKEIKHPYHRGVQARKGIEF